MVIMSIGPIRFIQEIRNSRRSHIIAFGRECFVGDEIQSGAFDEEILQSSG
jgi:hypothetical protein